MMQMNVQFPYSAMTPTEVEKGAARQTLRRASGRAGWILTLFVLLYHGLSHAGALLYRLCFYDALIPEAYTAFSRLIAPVVGYFILIPLLLFFYNRGTEHRVNTYFVRPNARPGTVFKWVVLGVGCTYAVAMISSFFFAVLENFGIHLNAPAADVQANPYDIIVSFLVIALLAPLFEEIFFRGALVSGLRAYGDGFAVIVAGICFGMAHANYQQTFFAAAMGMVAGYLRLRTGSLRPGLYIHLTVNSIGALQAIALAFVDLDRLASAITAYDMSYLLAHAVPLIAVALLELLCFVFAVLGVILFFREFSPKKREQNKLYSRGTEFSTVEKTEIFFSTPSILLFLLLTTILAGIRAA